MFMLKCHVIEVILYFHNYWNLDTKTCKLQSLHWIYLKVSNFGKYSGRLTCKCLNRTVGKTTSEPYFLEDVNE